MQFDSDFALNCSLHLLQLEVSLMNSKYVIRYLKIALKLKCKEVGTLQLMPMAFSGKCLSDPGGKESLNL